MILSTSVQNDNATATLKLLSYNIIRVRSINIRLGGDRAPTFMGFVFYLKLSSKEADKR